MAFSFTLHEKQQYTVGGVGGDWRRGDGHSYEEMGLIIIVYNYELRARF